MSSITNVSTEIADSLLKENYAWVDERLCELYHIYALTASNYDEYEAAGVIKEKWDWVDRRLNEMCEIPEHELLRLCCPTPISWVNPAPLIWSGCLPGGNLECIEPEFSDRLSCQSPIPQGKNMNMYNNESILENYDEDCDLKTEATFISVETDTLMLSDDESCDTMTESTYISDDEDDEEFMGDTWRWTEEPSPFAWVQEVFNKRPAEPSLKSPSTLRLPVW